MYIQRMVGGFTGVLRFLLGGEGGGGGGEEKDHLSFATARGVIKILKVEPKNAPTP